MWAVVAKDTHTNRSEVMVHRTKTLCSPSFPVTLVGHSKLTVLVLISTWFVLLRHVFVGHSSSPAFPFPFPWFFFCFLSNTVLLVLFVLILSSSH